MSVAKLSPLLVAALLLGGVDVTLAQENHAEQIHKLLGEMQDRRRAERELVQSYRRGEIASDDNRLRALAQSPRPVFRALAIRNMAGDATDPWSLRTIRQSLSDADPSVRLAAVMAIRKIGPGQRRALEEYILGEDRENNRKVAITTLKIWGRPESVAFLVDLLGRESRPGVKNFIERALEGITGKALGADASAWRAYLEKGETKEAAYDLVGFEVPPAAAPAASDEEPSEGGEEWLRKTALDHAHPAGATAAAEPGATKTEELGQESGGLPHATS